MSLTGLLVQLEHGEGDGEGEVSDPPAAAAAAAQSSEGAASSAAAADFNPYALARRVCTRRGLLPPPAGHASTSAHAF